MGLNRHVRTLFVLGDKKRRWLSGDATSIASLALRRPKWRMESRDANGEPSISHMLGRNRKLDMFEQSAPLAACDYAAVLLTADARV